MENKTTIELLELISKLEKESQKDPDGSTDWEKYEEIIGELQNREPFRGILGESKDVNDPTLQERIVALEETVKYLRRHKHDEKSGDVMVRI